MIVDSALFWDRLHFVFAVVFHHLFPQLTMGIAWFLVSWKWLQLRTGDHRYGMRRVFGRASSGSISQWERLGIPMEFQLETSWGW